MDKKSENKGETKWTKKKVEQRKWRKMGQKAKKIASKNSGQKKWAEKSRRKKFTEKDEKKG